MSKFEEIYNEYSRLLAEADYNDNAEAQHLLGIMYLTGVDVMGAASKEAALHYFEEAAWKEPDAKVDLGMMFEYGLVNDENEETEFGFPSYQVIPYYKEALGMLDKYGLSLPDGDGGKKDTRIAFVNLGMMYENGIYVKKNEKVAFKYYYSAAHDGLKEAQYKLGQMYLNGTVIDRNFNEAFKYMNMSANQGCPFAQNDLGVMYDEGLGITADPTKALEYYKAAAAQGHIEAFYNIGLAYEEGRGVSKDVRIAVEYFEKAAKKGHYEASLKVDKWFSSFNEQLEEFGLHYNRKEDD